MGLLDFLDSDSVGGGAGRLAMRAAPGVASLFGNKMKRRDLYGYQRNINEGFERGDKSRNQEELRLAMQELMDIKDLRTMDGNQAQSVVSEIFSKFPSITPEQQSGLVRTVVTNGSVFDDLTRKKTVQGRQDLLWKEGREDRVQTTKDKAYNRKIAGEESLRKGFEGIRKRADTQTKQKLSQEKFELEKTKWGTNKKLIEARIKKALTPTLPKTSELNARDLRDKRRNDKFVASSGIPGITTSGKTIIVSEGQKAAVVAALKTRGKSPNFIGMRDEYGPVTDETGQPLFAIHSYSPAEEAEAGVGQDPQTEFEKYVAAGKGETQGKSQAGKPKPPRQLIKQQSKDRKKETPEEFLQRMKREKLLRQGSQGVGAVVDAIGGVGKSIQRFKNRSRGGLLNQ